MTIVRLLYTKTATATRTHRGVLTGNRVVVNEGTPEEAEVDETVDIPETVDLRRALDALAAEHNGAPCAGDADRDPAETRSARCWSFASDAGATAFGTAARALHASVAPIGATRAARVRLEIDAANREALQQALSTCGASVVKSPADDAKGIIDIEAEFTSKRQRAAFDERVSPLSIVRRAR